MYSARLYDAGVSCWFPGKDGTRDSFMLYLPIVMNYRAKVNALSTKKYLQQRAAGQQVC